MSKLIIATRGSKLALWQAEHVAQQIMAQHSVQVELKIIKTQGDIILDVPLSQVGGKGLFVKEIEEALLNGQADLAVHSLKDVPMLLPEGLHLGIIPKRAQWQDLLLSMHYPSLDDLPLSAKVGTSSLRRQAQILALRPDLQVESLRGNVDTRLRKLQEGQFDAIIMAAAGMERLQLSVPHMVELIPPQFYPAAGQGALGLEFRADRQDLAELLAFFNDLPTYLCVEAERSLLRALEGNCQVPIAGYATLSGDTLSLTGVVASLDGAKVIKLTQTAKSKDALALGRQVAEALKVQGADIILQSIAHQAENIEK